MTILLTATGEHHPLVVHGSSLMLRMVSLGTKFVLLTTPVEPTADTVLQKVYEIYADAVMKNPFHTPEMPIRSEVFDTRITALLA